MQQIDRDADNGVEVLRELVTELAHATRCRWVRNRNRTVAVTETRCKTPRLRPSTVRKPMSELREAKQVDALTNVDL
jgi:hypothetical protein